MEHLKRLVALVMVLIMMVVLFSPVTAYASQRQEETSKKVETMLKKTKVTMRIDRPCGLSQDEFVKVLRNCKYDYKGFLRKHAKYIWKMEQKYRINGLFYCGIFAIESGWGTAGWAHNYTGMIGRRFLTDRQGIRATFKNLSKNYIKCGLKTIKAVGPKYCSAGWDTKVCSAMRRILEFSCKKQKTK